mgnify:CR=1 FL=1
MRAHTLPANAGWQWIVGGFAIYRRNPILLSMLVLAYWFTVLLLNVLPVIGAVAASLMIPGLSVGLMQASRNLESGQPIGNQTLYGGLRENTKTLVALGALYLVLTGTTYADHVANDRRSVLSVQGQQVAHDKASKGRE